jgi:hypothetical protein
MATVPGDPNDPTGQAPVPPLPMLLMAGSIMHQQGKFQQMAGDVVPFGGRGPNPYQRTLEQQRTLETLTRATGRETVTPLPITPQLPFDRDK